MRNLPTSLQRLLNLSILLVKPLPSLLGQGVLVAVTRVVTGEDVDTCVQSREGRLPTDLGKPLRRVKRAKQI